MASGLGSFVSGAFEGYQNVKEMQRREALQTREEDRFAMEQERYAAEKSVLLVRLLKTKLLMKLSKRRFLSWKRLRLALVALLSTQTLMQFKHDNKLVNPLHRRALPVMTVRRQGV